VFFLAEYANIFCVALATLMFCVVCRAARIVTDRYSPYVVGTLLVTASTVVVQKRHSSCFFLWFLRLSRYRYDQIMRLAGSLYPITIVVLLVWRMVIVKSPWFDGHL